MRLNMSLVLAITVLLNISIDREAQAATPQNCQSASASFLVVCPTQWQVRASNGVILDLFNFQPPKQTNEALLEDGEAEITVESPKLGILNAQVWMSVDRKQAFTAKPGALQLQSSDLACQNTYTLDSETKLQSGAIERDISVYCSTNQGPYRFRIRALKTDSQWTSYEGTFVEMIRSFRVKA